MRDYILHDPLFICPWARDSVTAGKTTFIQYPEDAPEGDRVESVRAAMDPFAKREKDAVIFLRNGVQSHEEGSKKAWNFYADLRTACEVIDRPDASVMFSHGTYEAAADHYQKTKDWDAYFKDGVPWVADEALYMISMNDRYERNHLLHAPEFCHVVTRQNDVAGARSGDFRKAGLDVGAVGNMMVAVGRTGESRWFDLQDQMRDRKIVPYRQGLPYYLPDEPTMDHQILRELTSAVHELLRGEIGDVSPRDVAKGIFQDAWEKGEEAELALLLQQRDGLRSRFGKGLGGGFL